MPWQVGDRSKRAGPTTVTTAEADSPRMREEAVAETSGATVRAQEDTREVTFAEASEELVVAEEEAEAHMQELEAR